MPWPFNFPPHRPIGQLTHWRKWALSGADYGSIVIISLLFQGPSKVVASQNSKVVGAPHSRVCFFLNAGQLAKDSRGTKKLLYQETSGEESRISLKSLLNTISHSKGRFAALIAKSCHVSTIPSTPFKWNIKDSKSTQTDYFQS